MRWYRRVSSAAKGDFAPLGDAISYYESIYDEAKIKFSGKYETMAMELPGLVEYHYGNLQELEAILAWVGILGDASLAKWRKYYIESYARQLSDSTAGKYAEGESEVIDLRLLQNEVALLRNKLLGILKALDVANYQISNVVKLRVAGIEDATI
jgi:hypothetical protein